MNNPGFLNKRLFLLHGRALYVGTAFDTDLHAHHALQICVCLRGRLDLHCGADSDGCDDLHPAAAMQRGSAYDSGSVSYDGPGSPRRGGPQDQHRGFASCSGAVVAPDRPHRLDGRQALAALAYLDPQHHDARRLMAAAPGLELVRFKDPFPPSLRSGLEQCLSPSVTPSQAAELISGLTAAVVHALSRQGRDAGGAARPASAASESDKAGRPGDSPHGGRQSPQGCDPRISSALEILANAGSPGMTLAELARRVSLSPSRFSHLFREHSGLPLRRYLLWLRLQRAVSTVAAGASLTEAAHAAEFSDAAHMSRTFRSMFGISPSELTADIPLPAE